MGGVRFQATDAEVEAALAQIDREARADGARERESVATKLVEPGHELELLHDQDGQAFASLTVSGHRETYALRSRALRTYLVRRHYERERHAPASQALQDGLSVLEGKAFFEGKKRKVALRVADGADALFVDLGDEEWGAIEVTARGWRVVADAPVRFRRTRGMLALPEPVGGGSIDELRPFVNVAGDDDFVLVVAWLLAALKPKGPYPILCLLGEHGCAKSTASRVLRALVDPSSSPLRSLPRDERDLMIAARNSWCLAFDNLSSLPTWVSDALCRIATGGGFATRELFTDDGEAFFSAQRPVLVNGIEELATRPDLVDRSIVLTLPVIADSERRTEHEFWSAFEAARPRILGALLDALAVATKRVDEVKLERLPRMADFAQWIVAAEPALGWESGRFLHAYEKNRSEAVLLGIECDPVALAVRELARRGPWSGTAGDLHAALGEIAPDSVRRSKEWPKTAKGVTDRLRRLAPSLRAIGISAAAGARSGRGRLWSLIPCRAGANMPPRLRPQRSHWSKARANVPGRAFMTSKRPDKV